MLKRIRKNGGMTLIEVLVSMLVLSIAVVTVMTAFSMSTKVNITSKKAQSEESLMENLLEYAQAGGTDYQTWFGVDASNYQVTQALSDVQPVQIEELKKVKQGFYEYTVRVTTDTKPAKYANDELNNHKVIQFGGSDTNSILIDASLKGNDALYPYGEADYDTSAYDYFYGIYDMAVQEHNAKELLREAEEEDYDADLLEGTEVIARSAMPSYIDRELWLTTSIEPDNKMRLQAKMAYLALDSLMFPESMTDPAMRRYEIPIYFSELYDIGSSTEEDAKKLDQIYILYSEENSASLGLGDGKDIRILDAQAVSSRQLNANVFIVLQEETSMDVADAAEIENLQNRVADKTIRLSSKDPVANVEKNPIAARIYCSAKTSYENNPAEIMQTENSLVTKDEEIRVVTVTLEIIDPDTGAVLDKKDVTRLQ